MGTPASPLTRDVANNTIKSITTTSARQPSSTTYAPVAWLSTGATMSTGAITKQSSPCLCDDGKQQHEKQHTRQVRFAPNLTTAVWFADSNYDRRSIVVDLSKTPFALFRKDAVLMAKPTEVAPAAVAAAAPRVFADVARASATPCGTLSQQRVSPEEVEFTPLAIQRTSMATTTAAAPEGTVAAMTTSYGGELASSRVEAAAVAVVPVGVATTGSRSRSQSGDSWDSEESDSAVTDSEVLSDVSHCDSETGLDGLGEDAERRSEEPAFFGVWKRESSEGYEELLLSAGVPKRAAAVALKKHPLHIIDHDGTYFRLIVKNGLSKDQDNTFFIGDEPREVKKTQESLDLSIYNPVPHFSTVVVTSESFLLC